MNFSQKYPIIISSDGDTVESGFENVNSEFSQLFSDLQTTLQPNGHTHVVIDITDFPSGGYVPIGGIIMWTGYIEDIPEHWVLCDGTNGTVDLRNRFLVGAGIEKGETSTFEFANVYSTHGTGYYSVGETGGEDRHVISDYELAKHTHIMKGGTNDSGSGTDIIGARYSTNVIHTFESLVAGEDYAHENRPLFYAVAFIMRAS